MIGFKVGFLVAEKAILHTEDNASVSIKYVGIIVRILIMLRLG
jgi:hypothetical protein